VAIFQVGDCANGIVPSVAVDLLHSEELGGQLEHEHELPRNCTPSAILKFAFPTASLAIATWVRYYPPALAALGTVPISMPRLTCPFSFNSSTGVAIVTVRHLANVECTGPNARAIRDQIPIAVEIRDFLPPVPRWVAQILDQDEPAKRLLSWSFARHGRGDNRLL
jgi:hypothetical protein